MAIGRLFTYLCLCVCTLVSAKNDECKSTFCFKVLTKRITIDINLFNKSSPLPVEDLIKQSGYPVERHEIQTADGYILTYHRIPYGKKGKTGSLGRPVLVQHGLLGASSLWVLSEKSLGFSLADAGFDVWLGNSRGNIHSRKHIQYDPDKDKKNFWDFSWHEMGYYDMPAAIDYILKNTSYDQLFYIGHSMGTTIYFVMGSTRPEYMDKVKASVALAPVIFPWNIISPVAKSIRSLHTVLSFLMRTLNIYEVFPYSNTTYWVDQHFCSKKALQFICRDIFFFIGGFDEKELKESSLIKVLQYMPAGTSFKTLRHFRQISERGSNFQQFDYGYTGNMWVYRSFNPPVYDLTNAKAPVYIYYASNDWLAVPEDIWHAVEHLPDVKSVKIVPDDDFNHMDFMWASNAKDVLFDDIIETLLNITDSETNDSSTDDKET